jgi:alpha-L-fucosidase
MFYYSAIFDHNPQFDDIQPLRSATSSFIARHGKTKKDVTDFALKFTRWMYGFTQGKVPENIPMNDFTYNPKKYEEYLLNQLAELIDSYKPDGMWVDWYMGNVENSARLIMDFMEENYPDVVLTFNSSNPARLKWAHYTTGEAHTIKSAWEQGHRYRYKSKPWELVGPAATSWDNPSSRSDPYEAARIAVIVMANGGKFSFGLPSAMNGEMYPELTQLVGTVGKWYTPRRSLFTEAVPMQYPGKEVPGVQLSEEGFKTIGSLYGNDKIVHIINLHGDQKALKVGFLNRDWGNIKKVSLEPSGKELTIQQPDWLPFPFSIEPKTTDVTIPEGDVDKIDTIIRVKV